MELDGFKRADAGPDCTMMAPEPPLATASLAADGQPQETIDAAAGRSFLILCGDADHNLGDHAIVQATCRELRALDPDARITVVSRDPARARSDFGAASVRPGWRGLPRLCRAAAGADLVLCGGGGLFQDDDSLIKMPHWGLRVALVRLLAPRVVGYALGVGPLGAASSRLFARLAFACMEQVSVRDPQALAVAQALTRKPTTVVPDPAVLLQPAGPEVARAWLAERGVPLDCRPLIGVTPRRWFPARRRIVPHRAALRLGLRDEQKSPAGERLLDLLAEVLDRVVRRHDAYLLFLPTYCVPHEGDDRMCEQVVARMKEPAGQVLRIDDAPLYKAVAGQLDLLLGGRMHPTIFAAAGGTPVVGLAYNQKFRGFFELLGCPDRLLDVTTFVHEGAVDQLEAMLDAALAGGRVDVARIESLGQSLRAFNRALLRQAA